MMESPPFRIVYVPLGMTTFFHCIWSTRNDGMTTFSPLYMIHVRWLSFPIVVALGMTHIFPLYMFHLEWPTFSHCICSTWNDHLFPLYPHGMMEWPPFSIVYMNDWMTTFSHCIRSTWNDHLFPLYMIHVEWWNDHLFHCIYDPLGMITFSHCIWSTWNDHLFPLYMINVEWWNHHLFPHCIDDPREVIIFSYCIWSTWNDYLFPFYMIHLEPVRDQVAGCWLLCGFPVFSRNLQWRCPCLSWVLLCHLFRRRDGPLYLTAVTKSNHWKIYNHYVKWLFQ